MGLKELQLVYGSGIFQMNTDMFVVLLLGIDAGEESAEIKVDIVLLVGEVWYFNLFLECRGRGDRSKSSI